MSAGPPGFDVREFTYACFVFDHPGDHNPRFVSARKSWWVTRIQYFTSTESGALRIAGGSASILVAPNGCVTLEPNGAFKEWIGIENSGLLLIEYWFQTPPNSNLIQIPIDVTNSQPPGTL